MSKKIKIFATVVFILIAIIILVSMLGNQPSNQPEGALSSSGGPVPAGGVPAPAVSDFSALLSNVRTINIDTSIFNNMVFRSLRDYPVTLGSDTVGRTNPFAPIGVDRDAPGPATSVSGSSQAAPAPTTISSNTPTIQTLQPGKVTANSAEFGAQVTVTDTVPVSIVFEYGVNDTFGNMTTPITVTKSGTSLVTVTNLLPKNGYVVRAILVRGAATVNGNTIPFKTL